MYYIFIHIYIAIFPTPIFRMIDCHVLFNQVHIVIKKEEIMNFLYFRRYIYIYMFYFVLLLNLKLNPLCFSPWDSCLHVSTRSLCFFQSGDHLRMWGLCISSMSWSLVLNFYSRVLFSAWVCSSWGLKLFLVYFVLFLSCNTFL